MPRDFWVSDFESRGNWLECAKFTRCHDNRADDHQLPVITSESTEQEEHNHSSSQDTEPNG